ncbi:MAG: hypothetical protein NVS2B11_10850 [Acetobacteraceae bacterium]
MYSATAASVRDMWFRISWSTGRPINSINAGIAFSCTTARTRLSSGEPSTATSPVRASSVADCGAGSTPNPSIAPIPAMICPVTGS